MTQLARQQEVDRITIRFAGDSGDGMQLTGTLFSEESAIYGNDFATFPDYPAEIRAPAGTVPGVSSFQVQIGSVDIHTPGDLSDALICMNPAAFKANIKNLRKGGIVVVDSDSWKETDLKKADYTTDPLDTHVIEDYKLIRAPITNLTRESLKDFDLDTKIKDMSRNMFALGMMCWLYNRPMDGTLNFIKQKFASKKPVVADANVKVLNAGYDFAHTIEEFASTYKIAPAKVAPGLYRQISGNQAVALGVVAASVKSGLPLVLGSYPITPASDVLHELSKYKHFGVKTIQAEDEIAGVCTAIGASFAGALAITTTSGPGLDLKAEAIGLAMIAELPLLVVDIQRGGPSTGLPTKTEQSDLLLALYGRHGESPLPVIAASTPSNCFDFAYQAAKIALESMTPVILLTDGYLANGSEPWIVPQVEKLSEIQVRLKKTVAEGEVFKPYQRDEKTLARSWAVPGVPGMEHRIGGLEKENISGNVSYDPQNHEIMTKLRAEKIERIVAKIPDQTVVGESTGDLLVVGWGGTYGALLTAVGELQAQGKKVSLMHMNYMNPMPKNVLSILKGFKRIVVCELNTGQLHKHLQSYFPEVGPLEKYNKIQGLPFSVSELTQHFSKLL